MFWIKTSPEPAPVARISKRHRDVQTRMNYYDDPKDGSPPPAVRVDNNTVTNECPSIAVDVIVKDVTGHEHDYSLDCHGFQFVQHQSQETNFSEEASIKTVYYAEVEELLKTATGASRVFIYDHKVRRGPSSGPGWNNKLVENNRLNVGPLHKVHVDQSYVGAELVLREHLPGEADDLVSSSRYQIINAWRPIRTILKDPIAVADARSVSDDDLVAVSVTRHNSPRAETWAVRPSPRHRWYYKHAQGPDEVLLIKCFDSQTSSAARRAPHSAFEYPGCGGGENRQSIEVRALVFYDRSRRG